jgi:uncharacterized protein
MCLLRMMAGKHLIKGDIEMLGQVMQLAAPTITMTYGSMLALLFVALSFNVALKRGSMKISHGLGENNEMAGIVRAQENFAEYVPFALLLLAGLEMSGGDDTGLRVLGGGLVVARVLHALGLIVGPKLIIARAIGATATLAILAAEGVWGLVIVLS